MKFVEVSKLVALFLCLGAAYASSQNEKLQPQVELLPEEFYQEALRAYVSGQNEEPQPQVELLPNEFYQIKKCTSDDDCSKDWHCSKKIFHGNGFCIPHDIFGASP